jgi:hypothetical protein
VTSRHLEDGWAEPYPPTRAATSVTTGSKIVWQIDEFERWLVIEDRLRWQPASRFPTIDRFTTGAQDRAHGRSTAPPERGSD